MKILLLGDLHLGLQKGNEFFIEKQLEFLNEILQQKDKYDIIISLGDIFHTEKTNNLYIYSTIMEFMKSIDKDMYIVSGNHDMWYKESFNKNALEVFEHINSNIKVFKDFDIKNIGNKKCMFVPYLFNNKKIKEFKTFKNNKRVDLVFSHLAFNEYFRDSSLSFSDFYNTSNLVLNGHYHIQNDDQYKNVKIKHVGTPYHTRKDEKENIPGVYIYDTEENEFEFIENKKSIKYYDISLKEAKNFDKIENNYIILNVLKSEYDELGEKPLEKQNKLNSIVLNIKNNNPFEFKLNYVDDENNNLNENESTEDLDFSKLTDVSYMLNDFYKNVFDKENQEVKNKSYKLVLNKIKNRS